MGSLKRRESSGLWCAVIVGGCFLVGGILGCLLGAFAGESSVIELETYLRGFLSLAQTQTVFWSVPAVLWNRGRWLLCCAVLGLTAVGALALPALFGLRGFLLAFGVSCFFRVFGVVGLLPAALLFGLPALLWAPGFFLSGIFCLRRSLRLMGKRPGDGSSLPGGEMRFCLGLSGVFLALCVMFECGLLPRLLSAAAHILM